MLALHKTINKSKSKNITEYRSSECNRSPILKQLCKFVVEQSIKKIISILFSVEDLLNIC
ncbi:hypothetical protein BpHYR1_037740 [Brachionus plicatilis]|uniref:Uncharacterized protein n=1 Tax=Brachionus plicatilis TaxID=10195 RepID=A0A3M7SBH3_BRAPC|nr:hypothetical protein BpHYR1_037740 [Brachionus plicatilis]